MSDFFDAADFDTVYATLTDVMDRSLAMCLRALDEDLHRGGWDQPPRLLVCYRTLDVLPNALPIHANVFEFATVSELRGDGRDIADTLSELAEGLSTEGAEGPDNLFAWALSNEAYMASADTDDPQQRARLEQAGRERQIHTQPEARELRMLLAVDRLGTVMQFMRDRQSDRRLLMLSTPGAEIGGNLPAVIRTLMLATLGEDVTATTN